MSGYAASARIVRASPHVARHDAVVRVRDWRPPELAALVVDGDAAFPTETGAPLAERWGRFRERWAQLTFYLTDPNSWR